MPTYTRAVLVLTALAAGACEGESGDSASTGSALTSTASFVATADARVRELSPSTNYGTHGLLLVDGRSGDRAESYLKFDIPSLSGMVASAKLRVHTSSDTTSTVTVSSTAPSWTETGITWNTRPSKTATLSSKNSLGRDVVVEWDVTQAIGGPGTYGFALSSSGLDPVWLYSREDSRRPTLVITYQSVRTPYGPRAAWNIPLAGLPQHPQSNGFRDLLWNNAPAAPGEFNANNDAYTYPVYYATDATGNFPVVTTYSTNLDGNTMPFNPSWIPSAGTDAQIVVLDPRDGREWNLWQLRFANGVVHATNGNLIPGSYFTKEDGFKPSRGVGIQYFAMLVTPEEVKAGVIRHALSMPIRNTAGDYCVAPGTKLEHPSHGASYPNGPNIPEGMRFGLRATDAEIEQWVATLPPQIRVAARIIGRAMRDYGWFITDTSGSAKIQLEAVETAGKRWADLGVLQQAPDGTYGSYRYGVKTYPRDLLDGLMQQARIYAVVSSQAYAPQPATSACR